MTERTRNMVVRVSDLEMAKVHALSGDRGESIAVLFREWLRDAYRARFGEAMPPDVITKFGNTIRAVPKKK